MRNDPPSPQVKLNDTLDLRPLNEPIQIAKLIDTLGGYPFCYVYSAE
jgi:tyrosinase